jgi:XTP/dITP diphosphohydrolase
MHEKIVFATNNQHKLSEVQAMLGNHFLLVSLKDAGLDCDIPENQPTLQGNASEKARFVFEHLRVPCFADDTGLEVEALNGEPGVYSARYAGTVQEHGSEQKRTHANMDKLLTKLGDNPNRKARFRTVISYFDGKSEHFFEGIVNGRIISDRRGVEGFGYDPVFIPDGYEQTFAEMPLSVKNTISHRARAFSKFIEYLKNRA